VKSAPKWDKMEKIYAVLMYVTEALAILSIVFFMVYRDVYTGIMATIFTILTTGLHIMLLVYHRTRLILELIMSQTKTNRQTIVEDFKK
jgi:hypothetical protein